MRAAPRLITVLALTSAALQGAPARAALPGDGGLASQTSMIVVGIATDPDDNLYIADAEHHAIRKVSPAGIITTIGGTGVRAGDGGPAIQAQMNPRSVVWHEGSIYFSEGTLTGQGAESAYHHIRKIDPNGIVTTIVGTGARGESGDGGQARYATLSFPNGIAFDPLGNMYIADEFNHRVRMVTPDGIISSIVVPDLDCCIVNQKNVVSINGLFWPRELNTGASGIVYVSFLRGVGRILPGGIWGGMLVGNGDPDTGGNGMPAVMASVGLPGGALELADDSILVSDDTTDEHGLRRIDRFGLISTVQPLRLGALALGSDEMTVYAIRSYCNVVKLIPGGGTQRYAGTDSC